MGSGWLSSSVLCRLGGSCLRAAPKSHFRCALVRPVSRSLCTKDAAQTNDARVAWYMRDVAHLMPEQLKKVFSVDNMSQGEKNQLAIHQAMEKWQRFPGDTGSSEVQVAILTERIRIQSAHVLRSKDKDKNAKREVVRYVVKRNKLLKYMRRKDRPMYEKILAELNIRPNYAHNPTLVESHPASFDARYPAKSIARQSVRLVRRKKLADKIRRQKRKRR